MQAVPTMLELVPRGINKWVGLQALLGDLALPREAVMAIGDGGNDLAIVANAGIGVAMGNAVPEVRASALLAQAEDEMRSSASDPSQPVSQCQYMTSPMRTLLADAWGVLVLVDHEPWNRGMYIEAKLTQKVVVRMGLWRETKAQVIYLMTSGEGGRCRDCGQQR